MNKVEVEFLPDRRCVGRNDFESRFLRGDTVLYDGEVYRVELVEFRDHWSNRWHQYGAEPVVLLSGQQGLIVPEAELTRHQSVWVSPRGLWFWEETDALARRIPPRGDAVVDRRPRLWPL